MENRSALDVRSVPHDELAVVERRVSDCHVVMHLDQRALDGAARVQARGADDRVAVRKRGPKLQR